MSERYKSKCKKFLEKISKKIKPVFKIIRHRSENRPMKSRRKKAEYGKIYCCFIVNMVYLKLKGIEKQMYKNSKKEKVKYD